MTDQRPDPVFLSGGMRPGLRPVPLSLPNAEDVQPGSVMLDAAGNQWRATDLTWVHVVIVTAREHHTLAAWARVVGVLAAVAFIAIVAVGVTTAVEHTATPLISVLPLFIVAFGAGWGWRRLRRRLAGQEIAPEVD
ncbi:MAG: hypothetical protein ABI130_04305 [Leifsonia sp.]